MNSSLRVLIVDDERPARDRLARLLAAFPDVQVVGQARDGEEALAQVAALAPDALLLDVQMPGPSGLDVAASLPEPAPAVILVTAFDRYALRAFDAAALDYLLKPVEPERLARAIQRLRERQVLTADKQPAAIHPPPAQLLIPDRGRVHVLPVAEIQWLESADNYVIVHGQGRAPLMRRTLAGLLADLGDGFVRTHRGAAVALSQVTQWQSKANGDGVLLLRDGSEVPCSRRHRAAVLAGLGIAE